MLNFVVHVLLIGNCCFHVSRHLSTIDNKLNLMSNKSIALKQHRISAAVAGLFMVVLAIIIHRINNDNVDNNCSDASFCSSLQHV